MQKLNKIQIDMVVFKTLVEQQIIPPFSEYSKKFYRN